MREVIVDTCVLVGAFKPGDQHAQRAIPLCEGMRDGGTVFHMSALVPAEACGLLRRKSSAADADRMARALRLHIREGGIKLYELNRERMDKAMDLAIVHGLYGPDAVIVQVAQELGMPIETYDDEMVKAAQNL